MQARAALADRFPQLRRRGAGAGPRAHRRGRAQRAGQDEPARGRWAGWPRCRRSGGPPPRRWCAPALPAAFVRAEGDAATGRRVDRRLRLIDAATSEPSRRLLLEAEITPRRHRVQVNRQRLARARDLLGVLRVTVFAPDDLALVKEGPAGRRDFLDTTLVALDPRADALVRDVERVLRQRNALLRQCGGRLNAGDGAHPRRVGRQAGGRGRGAGRGPRPAGRAPGTRGGACLRAAGRRRAGVARGCPPVGLTYVAPWRDVGVGRGPAGGARRPTWPGRSRSSARTATSSAWPRRPPGPHATPPRASSAAWPWR